MSEPTPRQQAGYVRRLLRRGLLQVIDPRTRAALPASVELDGESVHLLPLLEPPPAALDPEAQRWEALFERLRKSMSLPEAEELARAVELEHARREATAAGPAGPAAG